MKNTKLIWIIFIVYIVILSVIMAKRPHLDKWVIYFNHGALVMSFLIDLLSNKDKNV